MAAQIAAHDRVEQLRGLLAAAQRDGDEREARRLRVEYERAKRHWHQLVRDTVARQRRKR
jgi:putative ubiquitin-RnfH superfamily antitoxin RatB of RatAB toxin-antitoxin module